MCAYLGPPRGTFHRGDPAGVGVGHRVVQLSLELTAARGQRDDVVNVTTLVVIMTSLKRCSHFDYKSDVTKQCVPTEALTLQNKVMVGCTFFPFVLDNPTPFL